MIRRSAATAVSVLALVATGCGASTPAESVPELVSRVAEVDRAAASGDPEELDAAVSDLLATVDDAESAGQLEGEQAERIREAADALLARVSEPEIPEPDPTRTDQPREDDGEPDKEPEDEEEEDEDESDEEEDESADPGRGESHGRGKGKGKGRS